MKVEKIVQANQPETHNKLNRYRKKHKRREEHLSFRDFEDMMKHDSYYRAKGGALRQK